MSNKTTLQNNNTLLANYVSRVNVAKETAASLPEAGGGGSTAVETCSVTITGGSSDYYPVNVGYTSVDTNGEIIYKHDTCSSSSITITCLKNSVIAVDFKTSYNILSSPTVTASGLFFNGKLAVFKIETDTVLVNKSASAGGGAE